MYHSSVLIIHKITIWTVTKCVTVHSHCPAYYHFYLSQNYFITSTRALSSLHTNSLSSLPAGPSNTVPHYLCVCDNSKYPL